MLVIVLFVCVVLYIVIRTKKLYDSEFCILVVILSFILVSVSQNIETFDDFASLTALPDYINAKITTSMENLISDNSSSVNTNSSTLMFLTTDSVATDTSLHDSNGTIDTGKFNQLIAEYVPLNALFHTIQTKYPSAYKLIFP